MPDALRPGDPGLRGPAARSRASEDELRTFCRTELGRYKTPKVLRFMGELPKGPSGKVQRLKLLEPA